MKPLLKDMTLRERIGQTICFYQYKLNQKVEINENLGRTHEEQKEILQNNPCGSFWCCGMQNMKNPALDAYNYGYMCSAVDYREWVQRMDSYIPKIHVLRASDSEIMGAGSEFSDLTKISGGLAVGAANSEELAYELGVQVGKELKMAGINWRWAPVCDVGRIPMRAFSAETMLISTMEEWWEEQGRNFP